MHTSTYRLQINKSQPLDQAASLVPYLKDLGVGAVYLSPVFTAVPGSVHGYDVSDPTRINPEVGGEEAFSNLSADLKKKGMECLIDIVPNHMSADPTHNKWWWDVLEKGPQSPYAPFFDIDWEARRSGTRGKVLLPVLGSPYGDALHQCELKVILRNETWVVTYFDSQFPLNAASLEWAFPEGCDPQVHVRSLDVHQLLERQFYRLCNWKTALHEANYRRFFDVSTLLGVRMEAEEVFEKTHGLVRQLVRAGKIAGVRVDHVDGLRDPGAYLSRLKRLMAEENPQRAPYILVEKILQEEETLPSDWPIEGSTGYEFLSDLNGLFVTPTGIEAMRNAAHLFQGTVAAKGEETDCKRLVLSRIMRSELNLLADKLNDLSMSDLSARDFTRDDLRIAVRDTLAALPVYRTYGRDGSLTPFDARAFESAVAEAARCNSWMDPHIFTFLRDVFLSFAEEETPSAIPRQDRLNFALRFQQTSGAVTAKGIEDTFFYRHPVLLSLHEVGSSPRLRGTSLSRFHERMAVRARDYPLGMLATSTHDTKRGEDARARLNALATRAREWKQVLTALSKEKVAARQRAGLTLQDEHYLYQTLIGAWPMQGSETEAEASPGFGATLAPAPVDEEFVTRVEGAWVKAVREAKLRTNWVKPDEEYEAGLHEFLRELLLEGGFPSFSRIFFPLLIQCARDGMRFSLSQLACKFAAPGVPDVYQGSEYWDLSMVDPDNRRAIDFAERRKSLHEMGAYIDPTKDEQGLLESRNVWTKNLLETWPDGRIKQYVLARCLRWRERYPDLFLKGSYEPLETTGAKRQEVLAFRRNHEAHQLVVFLPLRTAAPGIGSVLLPREDIGRIYTHLFTGRTYRVEAKGKFAGLDTAALHDEFPVAWLWREDSPSEAKVDMG